MRTVFILVAICCFQSFKCNESDSAEINKIEVSPFYNTIIFNDVVDIINELNKNLNTPLNEFDNNDSESGENIEDLLLEYQHYLDKAQEQRQIYLEKINKTKNKVPALRHENFAKKTIPIENQFKNYYYSHGYYNPDIIKMSPTGSMDLFIPLKSAYNYFNKPQSASVIKNNIKEQSQHGLNNVHLDGLNYLSLPSQLSKSDPIKSCFCKPDQLPCICNVPINTVLAKDKHLKIISNAANSKKNLPLNPITNDLKVSEHMLEDVTNKANTINVKIRVDIELPRIQDEKTKYDKLYNSVEELDANGEFGSNIKIPTTYFNFPIPIEAFGWKSSKNNRYSPLPMHKIMIHKKKKSHAGSNIKKHRKKLITFHNINLMPSETLKPALKDNNTINIIPKTNFTSSITLSKPLKSLPLNMKISNYNTTDSPVDNNNTHESFYFMVNISNNENETDDRLKTGNSIELDYKKVSYNNTASTPSLRKKRDTMSQNQTVIAKKVTESLDTTTDSSTNIKNIKLNVLKKSIKAMSADEELLYWPNYKNNLTVPIQNITDIIIERENKKIKLSFTKGTLRQNHTMILEQAIFGEVDWDDMSTVVPPFISFFGKYLNGVITFCSEKICHSMKCSHKRCVNRLCTPDQRFNHMGHCNGADKTDRVASMESIIDLPSNVAFKIVDMLQNKMLGRLFGKMTICIGSKCISFVTSKKTFIKSKCVAKDLSKTGHCMNIKKS